MAKQNFHQSLLPVFSNHCNLLIWCSRKFLIIRNVENSCFIFCGDHDVYLDANIHTYSTSCCTKSQLAAMWLVMCLTYACLKQYKNLLFLLLTVLGVTHYKSSTLQ